VIFYVNFYFTLFDFKFIITAYFFGKRKQIVFAVIVNTVAVLVGSLVGLVCKKGISEKYNAAIMTALGLCTFFIGISGALKGENVLVTIVSMVIGTAVGTAIDIDEKINKLANWAQTKFEKNNSSSTFAQGFVTAFLLWCIGSMTIVGSIQAGISHNFEMLYTKSLLDLISSVMLASALGIGVLFASVPLLIFQGGIVLLSGILAPVLSDAMINELICVGSVMIIALGMNMIGLTKIKVSNFLPAIIIAPVVTPLLALLV